MSLLPHLHILLVTNVAMYMLQVIAQLVVSWPELYEVNSVGGMNNCYEQLSKNNNFH